MTDTRTSPAHAATQTSSTPAARGRRDLAEFEAIREIGRGGMATIHLARERATGRLVALKLVHSHLADDPQLVARFEHEVRAQLGLSHANLVELIGWGQDEAGGLFMALELVEGGTLKDLLQRRRKLPLDVAVAIAISIARGLAAAHAAGLVHRDVKPANVMICRDGRVKVADFGIAKTEEMTRLTTTGSVIGTPAYMSPEQAMARPLDARSDLFSLGVVLHEMLVGGNPFQTNNPATTISRVVSERVRPLFESLPQTPPAVESLVERLLSKAPETRPADASEVVRELEGCVADEELAVSDEVLAAFVAEPDVVARQLCGRAAERHFRRGLALHDGGKGAVEGAIWELFLAVQLDPSHAQARTWLEQVTQERGWRLQRKSSPRIDELEAKLKTSPDDLPTLLQLAKLHKAQGNFLQVIFYYRRAKALRPPDAYTRNQIETLLSARAAQGLEATGVFETRDGVPVAMRSSACVAACAPTWTEAVGDLWRSGWGKMALGGVGLLAAVLVVGFGIDHAAQAARRGAGAHGSGPPEDAELEPAWNLLASARQASRQGKHEHAEELLRELLAEHSGSPYEAEAQFALGDALERQGRRDEALSMHRANVEAHGLSGEWTWSSQARCGELLEVAGDADGAEEAWVALAASARGDARLDALQSLGDLARERGRLRAAVLEYRGALEETDDPARQARLHLALGETFLGLDDAAQAETEFAAARDHGDHRSAEFAQAGDGLKRARAARSDDRRWEPATSRRVAAQEEGDSDASATWESDSWTTATDDEAVDEAWASDDEPASEDAESSPWDEDEGG